VRTHVALLRGINVGGKNIVKMAELRKMLEDLGMDEVATLLQSGNVVFRSDKKSTEELEKLLEAETHKRFGVKPDYLVRTLDQWDRLIERNPFPDAAKEDPSHMLAIPMKKLPEPERVEAVVNRNTGREKVQLAGDCLYAVFPDGIGTSKFAASSDWIKLTSGGTARNWNTVLKIAQLGKE